MDVTQKQSKLIDHNKDDTEGDCCKDVGSDCINCSTDNEPENKLSKISSDESICPQLVLNPHYITSDFIHLLQKQWLNKSTKDEFMDASSGTELFVKPYQICLIPDLLQDANMCHNLVNEIVEKVEWSRKQMDLYEFYQSTDLFNMTECKFLTAFLQLLRRTLRPWLEKVTNLKLDYVSASCSMYNCGDYLLVHDDLLKDRQIAFIYYLSPWHDCIQWNQNMGGCLEIFNSDEQYFPHFPVQRRISPKNNQFVFFKVGPRSFHQVGEVTTFDYPRLTINGWFHGASNTDSRTDIMKVSIKSQLKLPKHNFNIDLNTLLNEVYLKDTTKRSIQKRIEENSEICLHEFLRPEVFAEILHELKDNEELLWSRQGPANVCNYEVLHMETASTSIKNILTLFTSTEMLQLLKDYTDLDLMIVNELAPFLCLEVQRWSHGDYTIMSDHTIFSENTLDLIYYLNATDGVAIINYVSQSDDNDGAFSINKKSQSNESSNDTDSLQAGSFDNDKLLSSDNVLNDEDNDSVLLTITPIDNALNIVYRCEGTTKFTKYISYKTPLERGPTYVIFCSYKE